MVGIGRVVERKWRLYLNNNKKENIAVEEVILRTLVETGTL